jgi:hypothetical protein
MDIRAALSGQYIAALRMLMNCVELFPDDLWVSGSHPRNPWRIAYHAVFYAHLYLGQDEAGFVPWEKGIEDCSDLWEDANAPVRPAYTREEILGYIDHVIALVEPTIATLDLDSQESGFSWYKDFAKLEHEILSVRHIQGHVGQLSELLMAAGIDTKWISRRA